MNGGFFYGKFQVDIPFVPWILWEGFLDWKWTWLNHGEKHTQEKTSTALIFGKKILKDRFPRGRCYPPILHQEIHEPQLVWLTNDQVEARRVKRNAIGLSWSHGHSRVGWMKGLFTLATMEVGKHNKNREAQQHNSLLWQPNAANLPLIGQESS